MRRAGPRLPCKTKRCARSTRRSGRKGTFPARAAAISDFLVRPTLEALDLSEYAGQAGDRIYFMAGDNVGLVDATVTIGDGNGSVFESGAAVEVDANTGYWMYTAQSAIPEVSHAAINVRVSDRPGNTVEANEEKAF